MTYYKIYNIHTTKPNDMSGDLLAIISATSMDDAIKRYMEMGGTVWSVKAWPVDLKPGQDIFDIFPKPVDSLILQAHNEPTETNNPTTEGNAPWKRSSPFTS